jgi:hypothetical protein
MPRARKFRRLADAYTFPGFRPLARVVGMFGDPRARLVTLVRRGKKRSAGAAARFIAVGTIAGAAAHGICPAAATASSWTWKSGASTASAVAA